MLNNHAEALGLENPIELWNSTITSNNWVWPYRLFYKNCQLLTAQLLIVQVFFV